VNGQPGAEFLDSDGKVISVLALDIAGGQIQTIRSIVNPEKLGHLGPLGDVSALFARLRRED
jgi:RNA polymerase sigma-70 factor (ECF subfamily)